MYMIAPTMKKLDPGRQIEMHVYDPKSDNASVPKYFVHVVDSGDDKLSKKRKCAAFITPQGREHESVFASELGRQNLCSQAEVARLIVVVLGSGHVFEAVTSI